MFKIGKHTIAVSPDRSPGETSALTTSRPAWTGPDELLVSRAATQNHRLALDALVPALAGMRDVSKQLAWAEDTSRPCS